MSQQVLSAVTGCAVHSVLFPIVSYWLFPSSLHLSLFATQMFLSKREKMPHLFAYVKDTGFFLLLFAFSCLVIGKGGD